MPRALVYILVMRGSEALPARSRAWQARGKIERFGELGVFVVDSEDAGRRVGSEGVLVLHGFPSSSSDWSDCFDALASQRRTLLFDFPGYGFSDKPARHAYSLFEQADVALQVALRAGLRRVHLVAHDMGTSVATELLARRERGLLPIELGSLSLLNGSVYIELSRLTPSQRLLRTPLGPLFVKLSRYGTFRAQLRAILARPVPDGALEAMWAEMVRADGLARLPQLIGYVSERSRFAERWHGALRRYEGPALVLWGLRDPVAVPAIGEKLARELPNARWQPLEDVGHYPTLEAPERVVKALEAHFDEVEGARLN